MSINRNTTVEQYYFFVSTLQVLKSSGYLSLHNHSYATELKLLFIPIAFIIIRIWSTIASLAALTSSDDSAWEHSIFSAFIVFMGVS